jgi:hypothetical protein
MILQKIDIDNDYGIKWENATLIFSNETTKDTFV